MHKAQGGSTADDTNSRPITPPVALHDGDLLGGVEPPRLLRLEEEEGLGPLGRRGSAGKPPSNGPREMPSGHWGPLRCCPHGCCFWSGRTGQMGPFKADGVPAWHIPVGFFSTGVTKKRGSTPPPAEVERCRREHMQRSRRCVTDPQNQPRKARWPLPKCIPIPPRGERGNNKAPHASRKERCTRMESTRGSSTLCSRCDQGRVCRGSTLPRAAKKWHLSPVCPTAIWVLNKGWGHGGCCRPLLR